MKLLFFGAIAEIVGKRESKLKLSESATLSNVVERLETQYSGLAAQKLLFAVNEEYVSESTKVSDDDELAIFAAVSGG